MAEEDLKSESSPFSQDDNDSVLQDKHMDCESSQQSDIGWYETSHRG